MPFDPMTAATGLQTLGSVLGGRSSREAARKLEAAQRLTESDFRTEMGQATAAYQPYTDVGLQYLPQVTQALKQGFQFDPMQDPAYQANIRAQQQAINRASAASGGFFSGQRGVDLATAMSDLASREYQSQYDRYRNRLQDLSGMMMFGYGAMGDLYNRRSGYLENIAAARFGAAGASAAGTLAGGASMTSGLSSMGAFLGSLKRKE